ncbi:MAG: peptidoglycan DD-metalloendopeptidase family protein [Alphaproteobacteria bacterium]
MYKKNILKIFILLSLSIFFAIPTQAKTVSQKDLEKIKAQASQKNKEKNKLDKEASKVASDIKIVSQEMISTARKIQVNEKKLSKMEKELEALKENLKEAEENFLIDDKNLTKTLAALENLALKPTEALFVQPLSPVEIIRSAILLRETVPFLENNAKQIRIELNNIEAKKIKIEKQIRDISISKNKMQQEHARMKNLTQTKKKMQKNLNIKSKTAALELKNLTSKANNIQGLLDTIAKEKRIKAQKEEEKRLAKLKERKKTGDSSSNLLLSDQTDNIISENAFKLAKGNIPLPAIGYISKTFGQETSKGLHSKGINIKTRELAQVTTPFDGNVMFVGPFRGYKNLIIIDHGGGYVSLLSGLDSIDCELGQTLLAGEPIGQMPKNTNAELYLELRKDNTPINPLNWMKKG